MEGFRSAVEDFGEFQFPVKAGTRIQMMPVRIGDPSSLPGELAHWRRPFLALSGAGFFARGEIGYLTVDEKLVEAGMSHRRPGLHVDFFRKHPEYDRAAIRNNEIVMASDRIGCRAWNQEFSGAPDPEGDCSHFAKERDSRSEVILQPNRVYGFNRLTVHESMTFRRPAYRRFVRLVGDILAEYYTNYTANPLGVKPSSRTRIAGPRDAKYMSA